MPEEAAEKQPSKSASVVSFHGFRELVESVAIAFILAFLFRTFEAEAFVIPTGSMANTLMGRHKDFECEKCGYPFQVSASEEIDAESGRETSAVVRGGVCPMCRHHMELSARELKENDNRSFNGDRIIVGKFMYQLEDPKRWDVAVFKFPAQAKTNFIKRLVGLPNETVRISHGDLYIKPKGSEKFTIANKPPGKMLAMLKTVYDNDYVLPGMIAKDWPARWRDDNDTDGWKTSDHRQFSVSGKQKGTAWLQYRHVVPTTDDWRNLDGGKLPAGYNVNPQLITDFSAYNAGIVKNSSRGDPANQPQGYGTHWVGDLAVECDLQVESPTGTALLKLVEGGREMLCSIDLATGKAVLSIPGETYQRVGATPISKAGTYKVLFSNIDDQLRLWVDDQPTAFDKPTTYTGLNNHRPTEKDLAPAAIGSRGAELRVSHLKVLRDIYYIAVKQGSTSGISDFDLRDVIPGEITPSKLARFFSDPSRWYIFDSKNMRSVEFPLDDDQFFMLGDNSAMSRDSRLWNPDEYYVDRDLLIGKALYIYWPHSWDKVPGTDLPFPFFPNLKEMGFVR